MTSSFSQWAWQNPKPTGNDLHNVQFIDINTGLFVGDNGTIFKTINGGGKWFNIPANPQYNFSKIAFVNADNIWLLGNGYGAGEIQPSVKILFSSDGGNSWEERMTGSSLPDSLRFGFHDIHFMTSLVGWLVGDSGLVLKTTDAGLSWQFHDKVQNHSLEKIQFLNDSLGYICGGLLQPSLYNPPSPLSISKGVILKTTDGGARWDTIFSDTIEIHAIHFRDSLLGWAAGSSIWVDSFGDGHYRWYGLKTTNGGISWRSQGPGFFEDMTFVGNHGWAVTGYWVVLSTTDGGERWTDTYPTPQYGQGLYAIKFTDSLHGYTVGTRGAILQTTDGGQTWTHYDSKSIEGTIDDIFFVSPDTGWYVQSDLYRTTNGGDSWNPLGLSGLRRIYCYDRNHCWACGYNGQMLFSSGDSSTWTTQNSGVTAELRAIRFANPRIGWTGATGTSILKTTSGGAAWFAQTIPGVGGFEKIVIQDSNHVWIYGTAGSGNYTTDGGTTWKSTNALSPMVFLNPDTGWARNFDTLYQTVNGGQTWEVLGRNTGVTYTTQFVSSDLGWTVFPSSVSKTTDGGRTWSTDLSVSVYQLLWHMHFSDASHGWVAGNGGALVRYGYPEKITSVDENSETHSSNYELYQNYPNPFNATTTIQYQIQSKSNVILKIYDILGREIRTLRDNIELPGSYSLSWDGKDNAGLVLPSGIYFYRLQVGKFTNSNKMILMK